MIEDRLPDAKFNFVKEIYDKYVVIVLSYMSEHFGKCVLLNVSDGPNHLGWILTQVGTMEWSSKCFLTPLLVIASPFSNIDLRASSMAWRLWALLRCGLHLQASDRVPTLGIYFFLIKHHGQGAAPRFLIVDNSALITYQRCGCDDLVGVTYFSG